MFNKTIHIVLRSSIFCSIYPSIEKIKAINEILFITTAMIINIEPKYIKPKASLYN